MWGTTAKNLIRGATDGGNQKGESRIAVDGSELVL